MKNIIIASLVAISLISLVAPASTASAAYSSSVKQAQQIMTKFGIPAGPVDGYMGPQTQRGLCIFRYMSGLTVNRNGLDSSTYSKLKSYNTAYSSLSKIPTRYSSSYRERLVANETCQAMTYSKANSSGKHYYRKVIAISTGIRNYYTPNGSYRLNGTLEGWWCSTLYPETCVDNNNGRFAYIRNHSGKPAGYGNMYNFREFKSGGWGIHGSNSVPTYPASHGCIRVSVKDSDWMWDYVGNGYRPQLTVTGSYW